MKRFDSPEMKELLGIVENMCKLNYNELYKTSTTISGEKIIIPIDMSMIFNRFELQYMIRIGDELEGHFCDSEIEKEEDLMRLAYVVMNIIAHYRHFAYNKIGCHNVIIIYSSNQDYYERYSKTFKIIENLLIMFNKTIFIPRFDKKDSENMLPYWYNRLMYYTVMNIFNTNHSAGISCRILHVGKNAFDFQLLNLDSLMYSTSGKKLMNGSGIVYNNPKFITCGAQPSIRDYIATDPIFIQIIPHLLAMFKSSIFPTRLGFIKGKNSKTILLKLYPMIQNVENGDDLVDIIKDQFIDNEEDRVLYVARLLKVDVNIYQTVYEIVEKFIKIWSSKIDTDSVYSINELIEFDAGETTLKVNWLMEY